MKKTVAGFLFSLLAYGGSAQSWTYTIHGSAAFSSPKAVDLNRDQYPDVVLGTGNENQWAAEGILALDGRTGQKLWAQPATNQLYTSAVFQDVTNDGIPDVFLGGRKALFFCLNGQTGDIIWQFDPSPFGHTHDSLRFNLYTPVVVPDQNRDGYPDLINIYGGGSTASRPSRPPGWLLLLSGKTGEILARDTMPDGRESYSSPLLYDFQGDGDPEILFGSGEERRGGSLYRTPLSALKQSDISQAEVLVSDSAKGFIAVSSLADLTGDGVPDIACPALNEQLVVLDGKTGSTLFRHTEPGYEHYASPVIGNFTGDATADILCVFQRGQWPFYSRYKFVLIDGGLRTAVWDTLFPLYQITQHAALDADGDGFDELLFCANEDTGFFTVEYTHQLSLYDFQDRRLESLASREIGINLFSTPLLSDFDEDLRVEITYVHTLDKQRYYTVDSCRIVHRELPFAPGSSIGWGGYLGNAGDGLFRRRFLVPSGLTTAVSDKKSSWLFPNPGQGPFHVRDGIQVDHWKVYDLQGKLVQQGKSPEVSIMGRQGLHAVVLFRQNRIIARELLMISRD